MTGNEKFVSANELIEGADKAMYEAKQHS
ncbi:hypothetical protein [Aeromonas tecta]